MSVLQPPTPRLAAIERARRAVLLHGEPGACGPIEAWITNSWQRCLQRGQRAQDAVGFDVVSAAAMRRATCTSRALHAAAAPVLTELSRVIALTRYFSILTDSQGIVVAVGGNPDFDLAPVRAIARVGVDLSERSVGTTAISAALTELHPVWLHRGEHFFEATSIYSCAGAPIFGPDGDCAGMLDLTGVQVQERPELRHLAAQMAQRVEQALLLAVPHRRLLRLQWPGTSSVAGPALLVVDDESRIAGANRSACAMLGLRYDAAAAGFGALEDVFATTAGRLMSLLPGQLPLQLPLWSGLQIQVASLHDSSGVVEPAPLPRPAARLRDAETDLIRLTVDATRGNVAEAARQLGISRATVYRRIKQRPHR